MIVVIDDRNEGLAGEASAALEAVLVEAPRDGVTMDWLLSHLLARSPEFLFLAVTPVAVLPATSPFAGGLLLVAALPLVFHRRAFFLPGFLAARKIPPARFEAAIRTMQKILKRYERFALAHPHAPARHRTRLAGILVSALAASLLVPLPFSNVLPGFTIGTVALPSLEEDGRLLFLAACLTVLSLLAVSLEAFSAFHLAARLI